MSLLKIIFRKIIKNKWLYSCLLLGLIISVALVSTIPLYTEGILNRLLVKELQNSQVNTGRYPGTYSISYSTDDYEIAETIKSAQEEYDSIFKDEKVLQYYKDVYDTFTKIDIFVKQKAEQNIKLPILGRNILYSTNSMKLNPNDNSSSSGGAEDFAYLQSLSQIESHIKVVDGRLPSKTAVDDVYEVMVTGNGLKKHNLLLNHVYILSDTVKGGFEPVKVRPVCVFTVNAPEDPYWIDTNPDTYFADSFMISEDIIFQDFIHKTPTMIKKARWNFVLDYQATTIDKLSSIVTSFNDNNKNLISIYKNLDFYNPLQDVVKQYFNKKNQLSIVLLAINVPVILMLFLYMLMLCRLIINKEKNEIALLNSRGAKRVQIVLVYLQVGLILGLIALLLGPVFGLALSRILGASSGFLEFVNRKAITTHLSREVYQYSIIVVLAFLIILFFPVFNASQASIIDHKRNISRKVKWTLWEKSFLDIILIGVSIYGYFIFLQRQSVLQTPGISALDIKVDPLMFFVPPLFIIGTFLLFLRIYPYVIKAIYHLGRKRWSPAAYATLLQVGRSTVSYHFLMLFLAMTLSVGIFSATAARTININFQEKVQYKNGADIVLTSKWYSDDVAGMPQNSSESVKNTYYEPPYEPYTQLKGVEHAAKVFSKEGVYVTNPSNKTINNVTLMGIDPYDFGMTTWYRAGLLDYHINEYLNLLSSAPTTCIISRSLSVSNNINPGDTVTLNWSGADETNFTVMAVVDYWPSFNPNADTGSNDTYPMLVVGNLPYIQDHMALEPYEVWLKLKPTATIKELYDSIAEKKLPIISVKNTRDSLVDIRTSPFMLAINGALTMGFVVCGIICFMGFLIYWILEMDSRTLQYGVYSAMGLKLKKLIAMIIYEQLLTSGIAVAGGALIGYITGKLFVPFFQMSFDASEQVPPFRVITYSGDVAKIAILVGVTMILVLFVLSYFIYTLKIDQAIKLGEE